MSKNMAYNHLLSIQQHNNRKILSSVIGSFKARSNRYAPNGAQRFKSVLSAVRNRSSINRFKNRGMTIADYRAQPVISKSRFRAQPQPVNNTLENKALNRIIHQTPAAAPEAVHIKQLPKSEQKSESSDPSGTPERTTHEPPPVLTEKQMIEQSIQKAAAKYSLSPGLISAVIRAESNFEVEAVSRAGARGLMQLMPATAKELGVTDIFDIDQNIDGGARYLRKMLDRFDGNIRKALAAYNAGPGTVIRYNGRVPYPETRQYVNRVLRFSGQAV